MALSLPSGRDYHTNGVCVSALSAKSVDDVDI